MRVPSSRAALVFLSLAVAPVAQAKEQKKIDPTADKLLATMGSYLGGLQNVRLESETTSERVLDDGTKVETQATYQITMRRPNAVKTEQIGSGARMTAWYDGKNLTLYCKSTQTYATVQAPKGIDGLLDSAHQTLGLRLPAIDLAYSRPAEVLRKRVKSGQYLGLETVDGVPSHHLAFQEEGRDWQLWVRDGKEPVPLRYVVTDKTKAAAPQFSTRLRNWETEASIDPSTFTQTPPQIAKRVDQLPSDCPSRR